MKSITLAILALAIVLMAGCSDKGANSRKAEPPPPPGLYQTGA